MEERDLVMYKGIEAVIVHKYSNGSLYTIKYEQKGNTYSRTVFGNKLAPIKK